MAKKKERAFFICPRWNELAATPRAALGPAVSGLTPGSTKIMLAIKGGAPIARSTLRKALLALGQESGVMFDVNAYIVDQRTTRPR
jgi:hypothetical protein